MAELASALGSRGHIHRLPHFETFELRRPQIKRLVITRALMRGAECLRLGPSFEDGTALPHRVRSIEGVILYFRSLEKVELDEALVVSDERAADVVALDDALKALAEFDERKCRMVELRFFGGLSIEETAEVLGVSPGTVMRDWTLTKAWLQREIEKE